MSARTVALRLTDDPELAVAIEATLAGLDDDECEEALEHVGAYTEGVVAACGRLDAAALLRAIRAAADTVAIGRASRAAPVCVAEDAPRPKREKKAKARTQGREVVFPEVELWGVAVEGETLLDDVRGVLLRYLALPEGAVEALTLWTVHAHAHDLCEVSPLLVLKSAVPRCGKTSALRLLGRLVPRPLRAGNITVSAAFRAVEKYRPTLIVDEADAFMRDNEELRGLLNNGHERENATFLRIVGESLV